ncbi:PREDICTED: titin-like [Amphimedon queenslandica]|uniref:Ig-like domain-containing protein n=1 Tax=Amphimedon queenslandica TaxID=400682 RepID=A0AAN0JRH9_AMPQE|nr:PREDICTED: titin-like [Amphimedon queenslandica]|eukprot:XP_019859453.1 PREDICTED: titin-like [Amphimedon queenslandica]
MINTVHLNLSNTFQHLDCHITTNTDINTTNTDINSIVNVSWYRDNGNENRLVSDSEGVSILPIVSVTYTSFNSTLRFSPITSSTPVSTLGNYTCVAWIGGQSVRIKTSNNVQVTMKINNSRDVVSMSLLNEYTAGDSFNATCMITAHQLSPPIASKATINIIHNSSIIRSGVADIGTTGSHKRSLNIPFTNLKLSRSGEYMCHYIRSNNSFVQPSDVKSTATELNIRIPIDSTSLVLKPTESYYEAGNNITLSCKVTKPNSPLVDTVVNMKWSSNTNISQQYSIHPYSSYFNHILTNIKLSEAGEYSCTYYLNSTTNNPYIVPSDVRTGVTNVIIRIPNGNNPSITPLSSYYNVGNSISLICSVTYPHSPLIDIATNVNIQWLNSSNHTLHSYTGINNNTEHTISYTINNVSLSDAGEYTCQYNVSSTDSSFVLSSGYMTASTNVSIQIPNNKVPVITLIPHQSVYDAGSDITLSCSVTYPYSSFIDVDTNLTLQWFNSSNHTLNSSTIINDNNGHTLTYTISNARLSDAGLYTCSFFINSVPHIVTSDTTMNSIIISIKSKKSDTVQWKLNGTNISNDTYYNINTTSGTLTIQEVRSTDTGNYTCGSGSISIIVKIPDINVTGQYTDLTVGSSASINCTTMPSIPNSVIKWDPSSFNTDSNELIINPVMLSHNNNTFTCVVSSNLLAMNLTKSITISVLDTSVSSVTVQSLSSYVIGDDVSIVCTISLTNAIGPNVSSLVVNWFKNNEMITDDIINTGSSSTFNSTLTLTQVSPTVAGVYTCNASINGSNIVLSDSKPLCIKVNKTLPSVTEELSPGQYYSIDCITGPVPTGVSVSWLLTNGSIYSNNNTIMIPSILPSHNNNTQYICRIMIETNPSDCSTQSQVITFRIKAIYISSVTVVPTSIFSSIKSTAVLTCTVNLNTGIGPDTSFISHYWYQYSTDISNRSTPLMINDDSKSLVTTLNITSVQLFDAGVIIIANQKLL